LITGDAAPPVSCQPELSGVIRSWACVEGRTAGCQNKDVFDDAEVRVSVASTEFTEARQRPKQPEFQHEASTEIEEEISLFLDICTIFKKTHFDGGVRQHLHALRTIGGRKCVNEALDKLRDSMEGFDRKQIQKPSAYLLSFLKRYLRAIK